MKFATLAALLISANAAEDINLCADGCGDECCLKYTGVSEPADGFPETCEPAVCIAKDSNIFNCAEPMQNDFIENKVSAEGTFSLRDEIAYYYEKYPEPDGLMQTYLKGVYPDFDLEADAETVMDTYFGGADVAGEMVYSVQCIGATALAASLASLAAAGLY